MTLKANWLVESESIFIEVMLFKIKLKTHITHYKVYANSLFSLEVMLPNADKSWNISTVVNQLKWLITNVSNCIAVLCYITKDEIRCQGPPYTIPDVAIWQMEDEFSSLVHVKDSNLNGRVLVIIELKINIPEMYH